MVCSDFPVLVPLVFGGRVSRCQSFNTFPKTITCPWDGRVGWKVNVSMPDETRTLLARAKDSWLYMPAEWSSTVCNRFVLHDLFP